MTVPVQNPIVAYVGNGITTVFAFPFRILNVDDLTVTIDGSGPTIPYAISGIGADEGAVTFSTPPAAGAKILLFLSVILKRDEDYQDNGDLLADTLNADLDRIWMALQGLGYLVGSGNPLLSRALLLGRDDVNGFGAYRANGNRIVNLGYPLSDTDAATLGAARDIAELITSGAHGAIGTFIQNGAGAVVRTFQEKMRDFVSVMDFMSPQQRIAAIESNTAVDTLSAFEFAVSSGAAAVFVPPFAYRLSAQLTVPPGVTLWSVGFVSSTSDVAAGARLVFDLGTPTCVVLSGDHGLRASGIRQISIVRAAGTPPAGSVGLYVDNGYNPIVEDVAVVGHAIPVVFDGTKGGISCSPLRLYTGYATDAHMLVNSWPELRPSQCRFGSNGLIDVPCNAYVRFTGGGSGPNTAMFDNCQFNQGESGDNIIGTFLDFVNFGSGQGQIIGQFTVTGCHIEQAQHAIRTDASVAILDNLQIVDTRFQDNNNLAGSAEFWALNPATKLQAFKMADCVLTMKSFTLAPGQQMDGVSVTNVKFFKPISVTGVGNSVVNFEACDFSDVTVAGSFGAAKFAGVASGGALVNTATGKVTLDITNQSNWTAASPPTLMFGGAAAGITYSTQSAQWRLQGSTVVYQFAIALTSKGSSTGAATIAGLPFQIQGIVGAAGGGAIPVAANLSSMTGPVIAQPAAFATINLLQSAPGGYAQMTDANFTDTTNISGELIYPV